MKGVEELRGRPEYTKAKEAAEKADPPPFDFTGLDQRRIQLSPPPERPTPIIQLLGQGICTAGNLTVLSSQAKSGKSAVIGAMIAAMVAARGNDEDGQIWDLADTLSFTASPPDGKCVVMFDTEQSPYDSWRLLRRACDRVGVEHLPQWVRAYRLLDVPTVTRREWLRQELGRVSKETTGVHAVFIDGVADLVIDPNDPGEAFGLVEELLILAVQFNCPIIVVLHENPSGNETGKTRGHLGSQLERKAESNLRLVKDLKTDVVEVFGARCRSASIPQGKGAMFRFDEQLGRHVSFDAADQVEEKLAKEREEELPDVEEVFRGKVAPLSHTELCAALAQELGVSRSTAIRKVKTWLGISMIRKGNDGTYIRIQR
jgi:hypothetical protein